MGTARRPQPKRLPAKLLKVRQLLGLTQAQMAAHLGHVKPSPQPGQVSRFEQGQREPSLLLLLEYARIAGVSTDVLIDDELDLPLNLPDPSGREGIRSTTISKRKKR
jgi:transcriptional regulator with XRE-family HTH domain